MFESPHKGAKQAQGLGCLNVKLSSHLSAFTFLSGQQNRKNSVKLSHNTWPSLCYLIERGRLCSLLTF